MWNVQNAQAFKLNYLDFMLFFFSIYFQLGFAYI